MQTLRQRKQAATVEHLVRAGLAGLTKHGMGVTVDQIAIIAGVSRRTIFHHFNSRDDLLAAAALLGQSDFEATLPQLPTDGDWRTWVKELCTAVHVTNASYGRSLGELLAYEDLDGSIGDAAREIGRRRRERNAAIVQTLWRALGHRTNVPARFRATVSAHLSPFVTLAVTRDAGAAHGLTAELARDTILEAASALGTPARRSRQA